MFITFKVNPLWKEQSSGNKIKQSSDFRKSEETFLSASNGPNFKLTEKITLHKYLNKKSLSLLKSSLILLKRDRDLAVA